MEIGKETIKLLLFTDNMLAHIEKKKHSKCPPTCPKSSRMYSEQGHRIQGQHIKTFIIFVNTSNIQLESKT